MSQKPTQTTPPSPNPLQPEIDLLRGILHDLKKHYRRAVDLKTRLAIADRIALFAARISQLARAQHYLSPPPDPFLAELDAACEAVTKDWPSLNSSGMHPLYTRSSTLPARAHLLLPDPFY
jgi:hypothetical protein